MVSLKHETIWTRSILFLSTYQSLNYDNTPLNILLFRDFQKYVQKKELVSLPGEWKKLTGNSSIQEACHPYLLDAKSELNQKGHILVRAHLYPLFKKVTKKNMIYLAHYKSEFEQMQKMKGCHPLIYLKDIPEAALDYSEEEKVYQTLEMIQSSASTAKFFKTTAFTAWINKKLPLLLKRIRRTHTLFDEFKISKTIYGSTVNRYGSLVTTFAKSRFIFTVNIQHGILTELGHFPVNADLNFVWGKSHRDYLVENGALKNNIKTIGPVFLRNLEDATKRGKQSTKRGDQLHLLVAMQPIGFAFNQQMITMIENAVKRLPEKIFVNYKLHPDQRNRERYEKLLVNKNSTILLHGEIPLNDLITDSDIILTPFSTVAYEALMREKIVIFYQDLGDLYYLKNPPLFVQNEKELHDILRKMLDDENFLADSQTRLVLKDPPHKKAFEGAKLLQLIEKFEKQQK
ncbi:CDP-glycerol glycerophosphotransferase family protein [Salipaludibacillus sp. CF4.18]|uniref:CDP-glycerol glycerophosphotransferase family protein n=1 Tax=Salipaludibacillus sp. CF4.18 TaxID=3373081 RepID=UPI003EE559CA